MSHPSTPKHGPTETHHASPLAKMAKHGRAAVAAAFLCATGTAACTPTAHMGHKGIASPHDVMAMAASENQQEMPENVKMVSHRKVNKIDKGDTLASNSK